MAALGIRFSPRFKRLAPFFLAGPISGPLIAGIVLNFKDGRPILGTLYAILFTELSIYMPLLAAKLGYALV